jgi:hypothetical protein
MLSRLFYYNDNIWTSTEYKLVWNSLYTRNVLYIPETI